MKFWNWMKNKDGNRELTIEGVIAEESWYGDEVTPQQFRDELEAERGPIIIWLNSPGGDCIAASQIYTMLMDYPDEVTVRIDGLAASAASVIAMAGTRVEMAPTALMMIHNPLTAVLGDHSEMAKAITMLSEVKESIINAYEIKTDLSREELSAMMDEETWMNAYKAIELGFCDGIMSDTLKSNQATYAYSSKQVATCLLNKVKADTTPITALVDRLNQMKH